MNPLSENFLLAASGGLLIGLAAAILMVFNGRIMGLSGIIAEAYQVSKESWRWQFLSGLFAGGLVLLFFLPGVFENTVETPYPILIGAGLLVGFGTRLGGGCTSGHGICGSSRLSPRSLVATVIFLSVGILTATFLRPWIIK